MRDDLLHYYERELTYLRQTGAEFGRKYPRVASRLLLEQTKCDDPHVERLLEGFAFLAARVHLKLDDDFPEISEALLNVVYPHYIRPIPSMAVARIDLDPEQGKLTSGYQVRRGAELYTPSVQGGVSCSFRTCYDTTLWPIRVSGVRWRAPHDLNPPVRGGNEVSDTLSLELTCGPGGSFSKLDIDSLRFFLNADPGLGATLYELLVNNCVRILLRDPTPGSKRPPIEIPASALRPVGFEAEEGLLEYERRSFLGYRLLQEYFAFPAKFMFVDVGGLGALREAGFGARAELVFLISAFERADRRQGLETGLTDESMALGCTPIVNLFQKVSEPIRLTQRRQEYLIVPDARRRETTDIFSVDGVDAVSPAASSPIHFEPFYSLRHSTHDAGALGYWYARRRSSGWRADQGTDVYLSLVDQSGRALYPEEDALSVRLTCHNGSLPSRIQFGGADGDFELAGGGPIERVVSLVNPTHVIEPPLGKPQLWRLISQLSLNYLSLVDGGAEALRELLRLHDFADSRAAALQVRGITSVQSEPSYARIAGEQGLAFVRGRKVDIEFDEEEFAGSGVFLLASVLERFLGLSVSLNSFSTVSIRSRQRKQPIRTWPPRAGWRPLL